MQPPRSVLDARLANAHLSIYLSVMFRQDAILDLAFQALADPSRRAMVDRLVQGPATVSELAKPLAMSLPGVMQHLAVLEASGLVISEKIGRTRTCKIDPKVLSQAEHWIAERRALWERRLDRLGQFLDETKDD
jgi:DNA-binding transcriptional ArsR family regulator